jgi:hypothetical protein
MFTTMQREVMSEVVERSKARSFSTNFLLFLFFASFYVIPPGIQHPSAHETDDLSRFPLDLSVGSADF